MWKKIAVGIIALVLLAFGSYFLFQLLRSKDGNKATIETYHPVGMIQGPFDPSQNPQQKPTKDSEAHNQQPGQKDKAKKPTDDQAKNEKAGPTPPGPGAEGKPAPGGSDASKKPNQAPGAQEGS